MGKKQSPKATPAAAVGAASGGAMKQKLKERAEAGAAARAAAELASRKRRKVAEEEQPEAAEHAEEFDEEHEEDEEERDNGLRAFRRRMMKGGDGHADDSSSDSDAGGDDDEEEDDEEEEGAGTTNAKRLLLGGAKGGAKAKEGRGAGAAGGGGAAVPGTAGSAKVKYDGSYKNKQRVLVFCSRGVTARYRHLLEDLRKLIPHGKKDVKLDCKGDLQVINEIAEVKSCNNCVFLEARKLQDLYLWLSKTPLGPSVKFHVQNVHTMDELRLTGNAMLGSRPLLSFDAAFDDPAAPHAALIKALLTDAFGTPRGHPKSKPFVDRVMAFALADGRVWVRNYQIVDQAAPTGNKQQQPPPQQQRGAGAGLDTAKILKEEAQALRRGEELTSLVEIGPRFVLNPIRIFAGSFGGPTLYQNPRFVSPNWTRAEKKRTEGARLAHKVQADAVRKDRRAQAVLPRDELADLFRQPVDPQAQAALERDDDDDDDGGGDDDEGSSGSEMEDEE